MTATGKAFFGYTGAGAQKSSFPMSDTLSRFHFQAVPDRHRPALLWFTGLSGAGKTTLATALQQELIRSHVPVVLLDGDDLRNGLCSDLGFSREDRSENIRRITEVAALFLKEGYVVCVAAIAPYLRDRQAARARIGNDYYLEIFVKCDLQICERRDVKGLYRKERSGQLSNLTGKGSPYEEPYKPDLTIPTDSVTLETGLEMLRVLLRDRQVLYRSNLPYTI